MHHIPKPNLRNLGRGALSASNATALQSVVTTSESYAGMSAPNATRLAVRGRMSWVLLIWSVVSVVAGAVALALLPAGSDFPSAVAWQFLIWGAIDLVFAAVGVWQVRPANAEAAGSEEQAQKLLGALRFNGKLNWLWLATGVALLVWSAAVGWKASLLGHGVGVLVQGGFLFFYDRRFAADLAAAA